MGIDKQRSVWERMVTNANITQADINEAKERKANEPQPVEEMNPYTNDEMRAYMVQECRERIDEIVTEVKRKEERLSTFDQTTLNNIKEIVKLELKQYAVDQRIEQRRIDESKKPKTFDLLEDEWYNKTINEDEEMNQWLEKVNGFKIDREVMLEVCRESKNHIKMKDAVAYIERKYDDDEQDLLRQLKEVQERKSKVIALSESIEQKKLARQDAKHKEEVKNQYVEQMLLID